MKFQTAVYSIPCRTINCSRPSKYALHADNEPLTVAEHICEECAKALVMSVPDELLYLAADRLAAAGWTAPAFKNAAVDVTTDVSVSVQPGEGAPEAVEHVERCVCGKEFTGATAKAKLGTHKRTCEATKQEG